LPLPAARPPSHVSSSAEAGSSEPAPRSAGVGGAGTGAAGRAGSGAGAAGHIAGARAEPVASAVDRSHEVGPDGAAFDPSTGALAVDYHGGPVVLVWDRVLRDGKHPRDGHNLVYHDFAHKLDMLDGEADGTPLLASREERARWHDLLCEFYQQDSAARVANLSS
jgi:hypothetical protein